MQIVGGVSTSRKEPYALDLVVREGRIRFTTAVVAQHFIPFVPSPHQAQPKGPSIYPPESKAYSCTLLFTDRIVMEILERTAW